MSAAEKRTLKENVKPPKKDAPYLKTLAKRVNRSGVKFF